MAALYSRILPRHFDIPLCFPRIDDLLEFKQSPSFAIVVKDIKSNLRQYLMIREAVKKQRKVIPLDQFTYQRFRWAVAAVMTRQNPVPSRDARVDMTLIPFYDLFNHAAGKITTMYDPTTMITETTSPRDVQIDSEVFVAYGHRSNRDLFIYSGFVDLTSLENDSYRMWLGLNASDVHLQKKTTLLSSIDIPSASYHELRRNIREGGTKLLTFIQVFLMQDEVDLKPNSDVHVLTQMDRDNPFFIPAIKWLKARLNLLLQSFPATLEEHLVQVPFSEDQAQRQNAIKMKIADMKLLRDVSTELDDILTE